MQAWWSCQMPASRSSRSRPHRICATDSLRIWTADSDALEAAECTTAGQVLATTAGYAVRQIQAGDRGGLQVGKGVSRVISDGNPWGCQTAGRGGDPNPKQAAWEG